MPLINGFQNSRALCVVKRQCKTFVRIYGKISCYVKSFRNKNLQNIALRGSKGNLLSYKFFSTFLDRKPKNTSDITIISWIISLCALLVYFIHELCAGQSSCFCFKLSFRFLSQMRI